MKSDAELESPKEAEKEMECASVYCPETTAFIANTWNSWNHNAENPISSIQSVILEID